MHGANTSATNGERASKTDGRYTSTVEVTHISKHGFWLLIDDEELLLPFELFPWFEAATIGQINHVERPSRDHLHWPELDIDLSVASIRRPEDFPLVSGALQQSPEEPTHP